MKSRLPIYQVDAFCEGNFTGNPAAVIPLDRFLDDEFLQNIAMENNLSETAYIVPDQEGYQIRWFSPTHEVDLCGHATLASAWVIFEKLNPTFSEIRFFSRSGELRVTRLGDILWLDFPSYSFKENSSWSSEKGKVLFGISPSKYWNSEDHILLYSHEEEILNLSPDFEALRKETGGRGWIVTAPSSKPNFDYVFRFFAPCLGIDEDPATGSAQCSLTPLWSGMLNRNYFRSLQLSRRQGYFSTEVRGTRIGIGGKAVLFMQGELEIWM